MRLLHFYIFLNHFFSNCDFINDILNKQISFFLILHKQLYSYYIRSRLCASVFTLKLAERYSDH